MKILNHTLYTEEEIIKAVNDRLPGTLDRRMFSYFKDVRNIIPKPIRIKTKEGRSGAHSYYTEDTLNYLSDKILRFYRRGKTLKEIQSEFSTEIETHLIESDIFRYKCEVYIKFRRAMDGPAQDLSQAFGNVSLDFKRTAIPEHLNIGFKKTLKDTLNALDSTKDEEEIDRLFERLLFTYNQRLKHRMKDKVLEEKGEEEKE